MSLSILKDMEQNYLKCMNLIKKRNARIVQILTIRRFYYNQQLLKMGKRKIDAFDSVQFTGDWQFVKEKKERIKVKSQKAVNCEFYLTFSDITPLYAFLYLSLAPEQALKFQKIQPLLQKLKGEDQDSQRNFEQCRNTLKIDWNESVQLPQAMRNNKQNIIKEQNRILQIASRITEDEGKQLLKSGLSQRKIHLDFHTNDGTFQEFIIPTIQGINDCVTIIHDTERNKYLIAFMSHVQEPVPASEQKKQRKKSQRINEPRKMSQENQNTAQTFKDRPIQQNIPNPDDRPLPTPKQNAILRNINPNDKISSSQVYSEPKPMPTVPRQILNPDQKLLPPPVKETKQRERRKSSAAENDLKKDIKIIGQKIEGQAHTLGEKAIQIGRKVEDKVEQVVEDVKNNRGQWVSLAIAGAIVVAAIKVLRA